MRRVAVLALAVLVTVAGAGVYAVAHDEPEVTFCNSALAYRAVRLSPTVASDAALQDQGEPGQDGCDIAASGARGAAVLDGLTLGYDCKVRDRGGDVVGHDEPNRDDGSCGQADP